MVKEQKLNTTLQTVVILQSEIKSLASVIIQNWLDKLTDQQQELMQSSIKNTASM